MLSPSLRAQVQVQNGGSGPQQQQQQQQYHFISPPASNAPSSPSFFALDAQARPVPARGRTLSSGSEGYANVNVNALYGPSPLGPLQQQQQQQPGVRGTSAGVPVSAYQALPQTRPRTFSAMSVGSVGSASSSLYGTLVGPVPGSVSNVAPVAGAGASNGGNAPNESGGHGAGVFASSSQEVEVGAGDEGKREEERRQIQDGEEDRGAVEGRPEGAAFLSGHPLLRDDAQANLVTQSHGSTTETTGSKYGQATTIESVLAAAQAASGFTSTGARDGTTMSNEGTNGQSLAGDEQSQEAKQGADVLGAGEDVVGAATTGSPVTNVKAPLRRPTQSQSQPPPIFDFPSPSASPSPAQTQLFTSSLDTTASTATGTAIVAVSPTAHVPVLMRRSSTPMQRPLLSRTQSQVHAQAVASPLGPVGGGERNGLEGFEEESAQTQTSPQYLSSEAEKGSGEHTSAAIVGGALSTSPVDVLEDTVAQDVDHNDVNSSVVRPTTPTQDSRPQLSNNNGSRRLSPSLEAAKINIVETISQFERLASPPPQPPRTLSRSMSISRGGGGPASPAPFAAAAIVLPAAAAAGDQAYSTTTVLASPTPSHASLAQSIHELVSSGTMPSVIERKKSLGVVDAEQPARFPSPKRTGTGSRRPSIASSISGGSAYGGEWSRMGEVVEDAEDVFGPGPSSGAGVGNEDRNENGAVEYGDRVETAAPQDVEPAGLRDGSEATPKKKVDIADGALGLGVLEPKPEDTKVNAEDVDHRDAVPAPELQDTVSIEQSTTTTVAQHKEVDAAPVPMLSASTPRSAPLQLEEPAVTIKAEPVSLESANEVTDNASQGQSSTTAGKADGGFKATLSSVTEPTQDGTVDTSNPVPAFGATVAPVLSSIPDAEAVPTASVAFNVKASSEQAISVAGKADPEIEKGADEPVPAVRSAPAASQAESGPVAVNAPSLPSEAPADISAHESKSSILAKHITSTEPSESDPTLSVSNDAIGDAVPEVPSVGKADPIHVASTTDRVTDSLPRQQTAPQRVAPDAAASAESTSETGDAVVSVPAFIEPPTAGAESKPQEQAHSHDIPDLAKDVEEKVSSTLEPVASVPKSQPESADIVAVPSASSPAGVNGVPFTLDESAKSQEEPVVEPAALDTIETVSLPSAENKEVSKKTIELDTFDTLSINVKDASLLGVEPNVLSSFVAAPIPVALNNGLDLDVIHDTSTAVKGVTERAADVILAPEAGEKLDEVNQESVARDAHESLGDITPEVVNKAENSARNENPEDGTAGEREESEQSEAKLEFSEGEHSRDYSGDILAN